jgi:hypothetical protein
MASVEGSQSIRKEGNNKVLHGQNRQIVYIVYFYGTNCVNLTE